MNNRGGIAVMSAFLAIPILLGFGLALDASMLWMLRQRLQWAVDDAALLAASQTNGESSTLVRRDAQELFWASFGAPLTAYTSGNQVGYLGATSDGAVVTTTTDSVAATATTPAVAADPYHITVTATAKLNTTMMRILGQTSSTITITGQAAVPHKVEMVLVLDNSLSMGVAIGSTTKLPALQAAANNMLTLILGNGASASPNVSIGIVPFAGAVNVGTAFASLLKGGVVGSNFPGLSGSSLAWRGCVQARAYPSPATSYDTTEDPPTTAAFDPYYFPSTYHMRTDSSVNGGFAKGDNDWTADNRSPINDTSLVQTTDTNYINGTDHWYYGPNLFCPHSSLVPLTSDKPTLTTAIASMALVNGGGTIINQGLQWGWFAVSEKWQSVWGLHTPTGVARPALYSDTGTTKIIVLMTDGMNEVDGANTFYGKAAVWDNAYSTNCNTSNVYPECYGIDSWYTSYGRAASGVLLPNSVVSYKTNDKMRQAAASTLRDRLSALCTNIKHQKVVIYTIFFHGTLDDQIAAATSGETGSTAGADLQNCATDANHYFNSTNATDINTAFQTIAQNINDLRVTQ